MPRKDVVPFVEEMVGTSRIDLQSITITKLDMFGDFYAIGATNTWLDVIPEQV